MNAADILTPLAIVAGIFFFGWLLKRSQEARAKLVAQLREATDEELATWDDRALATVREMLVRSLDVLAHRLTASPGSHDDRIRAQYQLDRVDAAINARRAAHEACVLEDEKNRQKPTL